MEIFCSATPAVNKNSLRFKLLFRLERISFKIWMNLLPYIFFVKFSFLPSRFFRIAVKKFKVFIVSLPSWTNLKTTQKKLTKTMRTNLLLGRRPFSYRQFRKAWARTVATRWRSSWSPRRPCCPCWRACCGRHRSGFWSWSPPRQGVDPEENKGR